jgi:alkanesulfonate monooxygenase SsuD/methylene tetrahydromethanopterin reductase-like flavin-dependent oxidoreductase (luciferase family)
LANTTGRNFIVAGRGSFVESYPLFGLRLEDYDSLFAEKLELLLKIRESTNVHWSGKHRAELTGQPIYPRPVQDPLPIWVGVGGTPGSSYQNGFGARWSDPFAEWVTDDAHMTLTISNNPAQPNRIPFLIVESRTTWEAAKKEVHPDPLAR